MAARKRAPAAPAVRPLGKSLVGPQQAPSEPPAAPVARPLGSLTEVGHRTWIPKRKKGGGVEFVVKEDVEKEIEQEQGVRVHLNAAERLSPESAKAIKGIIAAGIKFTEALPEPKPSTSKYAPGKKRSGKLTDEEKEERKRQRDLERDERRAVAKEAKRDARAKERQARKDALQGRLDRLKSALRDAWNCSHDHSVKLTEKLAELGADARRLGVRLR